MILESIRKRQTSFQTIPQDPNDLSAIDQKCIEDVVESVLRPVCDQIGDEESTKNDSYPTKL